MKNQAVLYGIIGLLAGSLLTIVLASSAVNSNNTPMMRMMGMRPEGMMREKMEEEIEEMMEGEMGMGSSMTEMMESMEGKSGEEFDRAFIEAMTVHHQGAIEMARVAQTSAKHEELQLMADDIISAQTSEIEQMQEWMSEWGD